jgi:hypothetical protein
MATGKFACYPLSTAYPNENTRVELPEDDSSWICKSLQKQTTAPDQPLHFF